MIDNSPLSFRERHCQKAEAYLVKCNLRCYCNVYRVSAQPFFFLPCSLAFLNPAYASPVARTR